MQNSLAQEQDIILALKELRSITASDGLKTRLQNLWLSNLPVVTAQAFPSLFRLALMIVLSLLLTGAGLVVAAERSQPGDLLYPVKLAVGNLKINLGARSESTITPFPSVQLTSSPSLTPQSEVKNLQTIHNEDVKQNPPTDDQPLSDIQSNRTESLPPTPTPLAETNLNDVGINLPEVAGINIEIGSASSPAPNSTPEPSPTSQSLLDIPVLDIQVNLDIGNNLPI